MTTLRNLAINTLRDAGHHSIAAGLREVSYAPFARPLDLIGLPLTATRHDQSDYELALPLDLLDPGLIQSRGDLVMALVS
ncbi:hypothetical protein ABZX75_33580 [Streptomyces sp. NPDC003038]|uniref:hypothetical protein n=1 Tax=unclassified Streptomyces TaxID=2593676 RepID=UPI0033A5E9F9